MDGVRRDSGRESERESAWLERRALILAPFERDAQVLSDLLARHGVAPEAIETPEALAAAVERPFGCLILTEEALGRRTGEALVAAFQTHPDWSRAPILALVGDAERPPPGYLALQAVADRVEIIPLERPARARTIIGSVMTLLAARARQYELRDRMEELVARDGHLRFLLAELDHRVKNVLAKVVSIANMTSREADDLEAFSDIFGERVAALARAHDRLAGDGRRSVTLRALVRESLKPFTRSDAANVALSGAETPLWPRAALTLAMTLHELATNAAKYGALSTPAGRVEVVWTTHRDEESERLVIEWRESGGPDVVPPRRRNFGLRMIEWIAAQELHGEAELDFAPTGLAWRLDIPIPAAGVEGGPDAAPFTLSETASAPTPSSAAPR